MSGVRFFTSGITAAVLLAIPVLSHAQVLRIEPVRVVSSSPVEDALKNNKGRASTSIQGNGGALAITYSASKQIEVYMVPLDKEKHFVPTDFLRFTLPATDEGNALINLMTSPGWRPVTQTWVIHLLSEDENVQAGFSSLAFVPASPFAIMGAAFSHLFAVEPYSPGSYHALRGYRVMNVQVAIVLGIVFLLTAGILLVFTRKERKVSLLIWATLCFTGLYQLRFSIDLLQFTQEHLQGYAAGQYDEAGSVYQIAEVLKAANVQSVYVCRDGTNYKEKILRYMSYPIIISADDAVAKTAEMAIVMDKDSWTLETRTEKSGTLLSLHCGAVSRDAKKIADFPDGSVLFSLTNAQ